MAVREVPLYILKHNVLFRYIMFFYNSLGDSSAAGLITRKVGVSIDAREGLKEALIATGLILGTGIQQNIYISAGIRLLYIRSCS